MASLPEIPAREWLEEAVAAALQCARYHIERSVHENEAGTELLELDVIATPYVNRESDPLIVEVKSGDWGFGELFKLKGWMSYLRFERAAFFASRELEEQKRRRLDNLVQRLNIIVATCPDYSAQNLVASLKEKHLIPVDCNISDMRIELWRYAYWLERILLKRLRRARDSGSQAAAAAINYHNIVKDRVFFERRASDRARLLYSAFSELGHVGIAAAEEVNGQNPRQAMDEALQRGQHPVIQGALLVEHRARLAVLKAAIDVILTTHDVDAMLSTFNGITLTSSFRQGLRVLNDHQYVHRYPAFWQVLFYEWGGVISMSQRDLDYEALSDQTGIPTQHIPDALSAFDILFPTENGWFRKILREDPLEILQLVPPCFRALGANARLWRHTNDESAEYDALPLGQFTRNVLVQWHNTAADLIQSA